MSQPAESNEPKSKVSYSFNVETREITRTDLNGSQVLATLKDSVLEYASLAAKKFHPAVVRFLNEEQLKFESFALKGAARDVEVEEIPKPPKKTIEQGDKTPAYVEWLKRYKPEEYKARYGIRGPGLVTKFREVVPNPLMPHRKKKVPYQVEATIAMRKTHLTEKPDANDQTEDEG